MSTLKRKPHSKNRGHATVEFLLSMLPLMIFIMWIVQFLLLIYTYVVMAGAAKEGVRYAVVHGTNNASSSGPGNVTAVVNAAKSYANFTGMTVNVTYLD